METKGEMPKKDYLWSLNSQTPTSSGTELPKQLAPKMLQYDHLQILANVSASSLKANPNSYLPPPTPISGCILQGAVFTPF